MKITLESDDRIRLTADAGGFAFESADTGKAGATGHPADGEVVGLSPFHLLAASLATCTYSVLHSWAHHAGLPLEGLAIGVSWEFGEEPKRVSAMRMELDWPGLPPARAEAARRAAAQCTVHHTLEHGSHVETRLAERPA